MPIDNSNLTPDAKTKIAQALDGKYRGFRDVVAAAFEIPFSGTGEDPLVPIDNEIFNGESRFFSRLNFKIGGEEYKVLKHNPSTSYIALPNFTANFKFTPLVRPSGISMKEFISGLNSDDFVFAANAMFHSWAVDSAIQSVKFKAATQAYINGSTSVAPGDVDWNEGYERYYIRWDSSTTSLSFGIVESQSDLGGTNSTGSFVAGVRNGSIISSNYLLENLNEVGVGKSFFAYNSGQDMLLAIIQPHAEQGVPLVDLNPEALITSLHDFGFDDVLILQGGDSVFLREFKSPGKGRWLVDSISPQKDNAAGGEIVAYGIERL